VAICPKLDVASLRGCDDCIAWRMNPRNDLSSTDLMGDIMSVSRPQGNYFRNLHQNGKSELLHFISRVTLCDMDSEPR